LARLVAAATTLACICLVLSGCEGQSSRSMLPPLRERNYLCQMPGPDETHEDEVACENNRRQQIALLPPVQPVDSAKILRRCRSEPPEPGWMVGATRIELVPPPA